MVSIKHPHNKSHSQNHGQPHPPMASAINKAPALPSATHHLAPITEASPFVASIPAPLDKALTGVDNKKPISPLTLRAPAPFPLAASFSHASHSVPAFSFSGTTGTTDAQTITILPDGRLEAITYPTETSHTDGAKPTELTEPSQNDLLIQMYQYATSKGTLFGHTHITPSTLSFFKQKLILTAAQSDDLQTRAAALHLLMEVAKKELTTDAKRGAEATLGELHKLLQKEPNHRLRGFIYEVIARDKAISELPTTEKITEILYPKSPPKEWFKDGELNLVLYVDNKAVTPEALASWLERDLFRYGFAKEMGIEDITFNTVGKGVDQHYLIGAKLPAAGEDKKAATLKLRIQKRATSEKLSLPHLTDKQTDGVAIFGHGSYGGNLKKALAGAAQGSGRNKLLMPFQCWGIGNYQDVKDKYEEIQFVSSTTTAKNKHHVQAFWSVITGIVKGDNWQQIGERTDRSLSIWRTPPSYVNSSDRDILATRIDRDNDGISDIDDTMFQANPLLLNGAASGIDPINIVSNGFKNNQLSGARLKRAVEDLNMILDANNYIGRTLGDLTLNQDLLIPNGFYTPKTSSSSIEQAQAFRFTKHLDSHGNTQILVTQNSRFGHTGSRLLGKMLAIETARYISLQIAPHNSHKKYGRNHRNHNHDHHGTMSSANVGDALTIAMLMREFRQQNKRNHSLASEETNRALTYILDRSSGQSIDSVFDIPEVELNMLQQRYSLPAFKLSDFAKVAENYQTPESFKIFTEQVKHTLKTTSHREQTPQSISIPYSYKQVQATLADTVTYFDDLTYKELANAPTEEKWLTRLVEEPNGERYLLTPPSTEVKRTPKADTLPQPWQRINLNSSDALADIALSPHILNTTAHSSSLLQPLRVQKTALLNTQTIPLDETPGLIPSIYNIIDSGGDEYLALQAALQSASVNIGSYPLQMRNSYLDDSTHAFRFELVARSTTEQHATGLEKPQKTALFFDLNRRFLNRPPGELSERLLMELAEFVATIDHKIDPKKLLIEMQKESPNQGYSHYFQALLSSPNTPLTKVPQLSGGKLTRATDNKNDLSFKLIELGQKAFANTTEQGGSLVGYHAQADSYSLTSVIAYYQDSTGQRRQLLITLDEDGTIFSSQTTTLNLTPRIEP